MQLKDVTPIIKAILEERDKIPHIIDHERYISNPQLYRDGDFMRGGIRKALRIIEQAPAIDAVPVVDGRWLDCENYNDIRQCSECGLIRNIYKQEGWKYCPNCGAKMDGGAEG